MDVPTGITAASFEPAGGWLHYLNILHYLLLLATIALVASGGSESPMMFIIVTAALMLLTAVDLYSNVLRIPLFFVFLARVGMLGIPLLIAGLGPSERARSMGILCAVLSFPIILALFLGAWIPILADPRLAF